MDRGRKPFISILTATYNRAEYLKRAYLSILANSKSGEKIEWLIMDDGSTDNTREVVNKMVENENLSINYYYQKNMGKMAAINHLTSIATGEYMMDLDSDDMLSENAIETIKNNLPMTAAELRKVFKDSGILDINIEKLIKNKEYSLMLSKIIDKDYSLVIASNLLLGPISQYLNENSKNIEDTLFTNKRFEDVLKAFLDEEIDNKMFKDMLSEEGQILKNIYSTELRLDTTLTQNEKYKEDLIDEDSLRTIIIEIINNSKTEVEEIKAGNTRKIQYLVGQTMKKTNGKVSPKSINQIINEELGKL